MTTLDFSPRPGAAPLPRMVLAQAGAEARAMLRNGEQLLLTMIIPILLLVGFSQAALIDVSGSRIGFVTPGILSLAVMSTAFTGQAIATGFERRYGVLKRLGATPLSRTGLLLAKTCAVIAVEIVQVVVIGAVALALGWSPQGDPLWVVLLVLLGTAAFSGLGLLMAGTLRAEATLAGANLVYLLLLGLGGVVFPLTKFPDGVRPVLELLPITALTDGMRSVLENGAGFPTGPVIVLACWTVAGLGLAARTFRWE
ncbi:ABC transporter permease [Planotetraspora mira]|jgi:ABC-2 type transport system permease protein|uniref:Transport permease protein n=1 Tax=Planotetraspora mira TaxID=58121 RepID=A0A8J3TRY8_9ACTN|nr:ABC transporter permease [Planotetraspora mira]GII32063.1 transport permease protein [Planotetraspora mira]